MPQPSNVLSSLPGSQFSLPSIPRNLDHLPISVAKISVSLPSESYKKPRKTTLSVSLPLPPETIAAVPHSEFQEKMLYLDSIGIDFFHVVAEHPPIVSVSLADIKSIFRFLEFMSFTESELRRIVGMCPDILNCRTSDISAVFDFLSQEVGVRASNFRHVLHRRPRLLACSVENRLRPTLLFLQKIGISDASRYTSLLSCSVVDKLMPRIEYLMELGFPRQDALYMIRSFPVLFNYSIKNNLEKKINYFVMEMGRDIRELRDFPQYFSFNLEKRIKRRHQCCMEKGLYLPLPVMLKTSEEKFHSRLDACSNSSLPLRTSPLLYVSWNINSM